MPQPTNKITQFWQELKRRKVIKVIAMYAGTAYVLIELANNVVTPLNLPDWTPRLVILIALIGFPIIVILSWVFDITSEGIGKTASLEELQKQDPLPPASKRRLKASDVVIGVLVIIVGVLAYPRIFKNNGNLNVMTMPVTMINEFGEKETRRVFKEDYVTNLAIFPFVNKKNDPIDNWFQYGISFALAVDMVQHNYLALDYNTNAIHLQQQIYHAETNNCPVFISGSFTMNDSAIEIITRLYETANGKVIKEMIYKGSDFNALIDSISRHARIDLGIARIILDSSPDLPVSEQLSNNVSAFCSFIQGYYYRQLDYPTPFTGFTRAIELDSTFAMALLMHAHFNHNGNWSSESASRVITQAMQHREKLSEYFEILIRRKYFEIHGEKNKAIVLTEMHHNLQPYNPYILSTLRSTYQKYFMIHKFEKAAYELNELIPNRTINQNSLALSYLFTGKLDKSFEVLEELLKNDPENTTALLLKGKAYLLKNDLDAAENTFQEAILYRPEYEIYWSKWLDHISYRRKHTMKNHELEPFSGSYRYEVSELRDTLFVFNNHLISTTEDQDPYFCYQVSDNQFRFTNTLRRYTFVGNTQGRVTKLILDQGDLEDIIYIAWKEDSTIQHAKFLLKNGNLSQALSAFRKALDHNPEHYYLANYIQYLEFAQSPEYETFNSVFHEYEGEYGDLRLYKEGDRFYKTDNRGMIYQLLPMAEDIFMIPSIYNAQIHIIQDDEGITGLKNVVKDGIVTFYQRTSEQALASQNQR